MISHCGIENIKKLNVFLLKLGMILDEKSRPDFKIFKKIRYLIYVSIYQN